MIKKPEWLKNNTEPVKPKPLQGRFRKHIEERAPLLLKQKSRQDIKLAAAEQAILKKNIIGDVYKKDFIWGCAMCGSCEEACPVSVEHTPKIIAMRRHLVLAKKEYPGEMRKFFSNIESHGNPWGVARHDNNCWSASSGNKAIAGSNLAEYVFFAGCAASFDPKAGRAAAALNNMMRKAGLSFTTLGAGEWCCGETARRMGHEALFQQIAKNNIRKWNQLGVRKIITSCAHCYNTLKNVRKPDCCRPGTAGGCYRGIRAVHCLPILPDADGGDGCLPGDAGANSGPGYRRTPGNGHVIRPV